MTGATLRSLRYEYEVFIDAEIERYKESVARPVILKIADEALTSLRAQPQYEPEELSLCDEVNKLIRGRLGLPKYETWRRKRLKVLAEYQRPERWGIRPDAPLVREIRPSAEAHVLVAGGDFERATLYLAAHGCAVTAIDRDEEALERLVFAASPAGLNSRVRAQLGELAHWEPDMLLSAVVCTAESLAALTVEERARVISQLQRATRAGGVHLVEPIAAGESVSIEELRLRYDGWTVAVERESASTRSFVARKAAA